MKLLLLSLFWAVTGWANILDQSFSPPTCSALATTVNRLITSGEEAALQEMRIYLEAHKSSYGYESRACERVGWLLRILYTPKETTPLRAPRFGGLLMPFEMANRDDWPLFPVAESNGVYFILDESYTIAGVPEDPFSYIHYCREAGVFRTGKVAVVNERDAALALDSLLKSDAWRRIKWRDAGLGYSYTMNEGQAVEWIRKQTEPETR